ncbi:hypothetical protein DFH07DRAFT_830632 [Mycena maculata]|uniref:Uncharacterized protein n=1 Tax=Mycena maculata TaxID=230809 RepID=A0AAD7N5W8_9AGAR|nr:hypothetical protein DFH07DRAFT_830632 [Mycena maculata]
MGSNHNQSSPLAPLVHATHEPNLVGQETYIVEPQSGDIFVMTGPSDPLRRFPFSMSEVFVGRKETTLLILELETGEVKVAARTCDVFLGRDADDLNGSCADESDGAEPQTSEPTQVFIERTYYHITAHTNKHGAPVQNLSFSAYGPNKQDNLLQASYGNTMDHMYTQSSPIGLARSFKVERHAEQGPTSNVTLWAILSMNNPVVAVFDILRSPSRDPPNPFVLLQPRPPLPVPAVVNLAPSSRTKNQTPDLASVYVGLVKGPESLFAMSAERFPLVASRDGMQRRVNLTPVRVPAPSRPRDPSEVDDVGGAQRVMSKGPGLEYGPTMSEGREYGPTDAQCKDIDESSLYRDRWCLVGYHTLDRGDGDPEMRQ